MANMASNSFILSHASPMPLFGPGPKQPTQSKRRDGRTGSAGSAKVQVTDAPGWHGKHGFIGWDRVPLRVWLPDQTHRQLLTILLQTLIGSHRHQFGHLPHPFIGHFKSGQSKQHFFANIV